MSVMILWDFRNFVELSNKKKWVENFKHIYILYYYKVF